MSIPKNASNHITKALEHIERAKAEQRYVDCLGAVSRLYYACHHICIAFIFMENKSYTVNFNAGSHSTVNSDYNKLYNGTKGTKIYSKGTAVEYLKRWQRSREYADYGIYTYENNNDNHIKKTEEVEQNIIQMVEFLNAHIEHLNKKYREDIVAIHDSLLQMLSLPENINSSNSFI